MNSIMISILYRENDRMMNNSDTNANSKAGSSIKVSPENANGLYSRRTKYLFFSNKSKFLVRYITTCIVIVTYYTCKCQRNIKALGLSYCKNNEIKRLNQKLFPYVYDLLSNNSKHSRRDA